MDKDELNNNSSPNGRGGDYEDVCFICRRPESITGKMFRLPNGITVCNDCMQRTMDAVSKYDYQGILNSMGFPGMGFTPGGGPNNLSDTTPGAGENDPQDPPTGEPKDPPGEPPKEPPSKGSPGGNPTNPIFPEGFPQISFVNLGNLTGGIPSQQRVKKRAEKKKEAPPVLDIKNIPPPHKIKGQLDDYIIGQEHAKKVISVAVYNHYKRVATGTMDDIEIEKSNMLMIGPTGCGKTYLVKTLARLLDVPLAMADATSLTEAGYIGDDIESVLSKLLAAADNDADRAEQGIVFIDEIDKIAKKKNTHNRDVSGESVQQGLLRLLEGARVEVPVGAGSKNAMVPLTTIDTRNILFICGGAFPDLEEIIKQRLSKQSAIGFNGELKDKYDKDKNILSRVNLEDLRKYGMIPEFLGRLPVVYTLEGISKEMMVKILKEPKNAILKQYQKLLALDEVKLEFDDSALEAIAEKAMEKETGARALRAIIEEFMLDIMYEIPKDDNIGRVIITGDYIRGNGGPVIDIRRDGYTFDEIEKLREIRDN